MTQITGRDTIRIQVIQLLTQIAPEVSPDEIGTSVMLRDQLDIDSMDFLNFLISVATKYQIEIPEADYSKLPSVDSIVDYILARIPG